MVVLGKGAVSYERGTPVSCVCEEALPGLLYMSSRGYISPTRMKIKTSLLFLITLKLRSY